jgi:hypothetical protein
MKLENIDKARGLIRQYDSIKNKWFLLEGKYQGASKKNKQKLLIQIEQAMQELEVVELKIQEL